MKKSSNKNKSVAFSANPILSVRLPMWRSKLVVFLLFMAFVALTARAFWIQGPGNAFYQKQGESRYQRRLELPATRGKILDRNGLVLATSLPVRAIWAIPESVPDDLGADKLADLAKLLDMTQPELRKKLSEDKTFVYVKRQVPVDIAAKVEALNIPGIYQRNEYKRFYPEGEITAHLIGFTNVEDEGQEGVELGDQKLLAGMAGSRRVIKDRLGHIVEDVGEQVPPVDGRDLQLSVDSKIQFFAYQKLRDAVIENRARGGSVVVLDASTGEVLALANYPSYSPNRRQNLSGEQLRNRALTDVFEPGSTMKPFTVGLALETGLVTPQTPIQTAPGYIVIGGMRISDSHAHGVLTVQEVIQKSSNIGTLKIALQMQPRQMWELFTQVGFGQKPQVTFPGAVGGRLRPYKTWKPVEQATMSYGYGMSASLFQMARSYTVFAHDGQIIPATLLKSPEPAAGVQVFSPGTVAEIRKMLQMAAGPGGTGPKAQTVGYSVGGKSGTAYKQVGKAYATNKYRSWFVGIAPIDKPRIIVAVMVDEPSAGKYFGGDVAAPVFSATVQQTLRMMGVQPDMNVKPQIVVNAVEESF